MKGNFQVRFLEGGGLVTARFHSAWSRLVKAKTFLEKEREFRLRRRQRSGFIRSGQQFDKVSDKESLKAQAKCPNSSGRLEACPWRLDIFLCARARTPKASLIPAWGEVGEAPGQCHQTDQSANGATQAIWRRSRV